MVKLDYLSIAKAADTTDQAVVFILKQIILAIE